MSVTERNFHGANDVYPAALNLSNFSNRKGNRLRTLGVVPIHVQYWRVNHLANV